MEKLVRELIKQFKMVVKESYYMENHSDNVEYPYLTFTLSEERLNSHRSGFYIDCKLYDSSTSVIDLLSLESSLKAHFKDKQVFTNYLYIRFEYLRGNDFNTGNKLIKRRNLQFYCIVDWRNI